MTAWGQTETFDPQIFRSATDLIADILAPVVRVACRRTGTALPFSTTFC